MHCLFRRNVLPPVFPILVSYHFRGLNLKSLTRWKCCHVFFLWQEHLRRCRRSPPQNEQLGLKRGGNHRQSMPHNSVRFVTRNVRSGNRSNSTYTRSLSSQPRATHALGLFSSLPQLCWPGGVSWVGEKQGEHHESTGAWKWVGHFHVHVRTEDITWWNHVAHVGRMSQKTDKMPVLSCASQVWRHAGW